MNKIVEFFKGMVDWVLDKFKKEGVKRTLTAIAVVVIILIAMAGLINNGMKIIRS